MKTEMEKCLAGEWYDCHNQVFLDLKTRTHKLLMKYNSLPYEDKEEKHSLLKKMLGSIGMKVSVASPFICDYGCNIQIGDNVTVDTGCTCVDCNKIRQSPEITYVFNIFSAEFFDKFFCCIWVRYNKVHTKRKCCFCNVLANFSKPYNTKSFSKNFNTCKF